MKYIINLTQFQYTFLGEIGTKCVNEVLNITIIMALFLYRLLFINNKSSTKKKGSRLNQSWYVQEHKPVIRIFIRRQS